MSVASEGGWLGEGRGPRQSTRGVLPVAVALLALAAAAAALAPRVARAQPIEPGAPERQKIEAQAVEAFKRLVSLWREELYFELYDHGMEDTKARISKEEFAQRMVQLNWLPEAELNPKFLKAELRFRTMVYVTARIVYRNKFKQDESFTREQTLLLLLEGKTWRLDLIQLIRAPFV
ncbi:MAG: hypothetical protein HY423_16565 [Candidatus Lambdaproteobacteria bacterium]|nr:hypothetical protein [Candidatus Lambdaproteobacteria bacterium]